MAKIIDPDLLVVDTEIAIDTTLKTFTLTAAGNLTAKDGVSLQAIYSKFVDLWTTAAYNKYPFPMYAIDALSGQFVIGFDGSSYNGWAPADDTTRQMIRDAGWSEFDDTGDLLNQYVGIVSLGEVNDGAQLYYQREVGGTSIDFTFDDEVNEGIKIFGNADNGDFDTRTYFKGYVREYGKKYTDSILADTGKTATGAYIVNMLLSNEDDLKIQDTDANVAINTPYTNITVTYYDTDQARTIGGVEYQFRIIIEGASATAEEIYTKVQYLLRQATDIDEAVGGIIGKTASSLLAFVGDNLYTTTGVYIDNYATDDINRIYFTDQSGIERSEPYTAAGSMNFNSYLTAGGTGYYRMYFLDLPDLLDYGLTGALTVQDATDADIAGVIDSASIDFSFAYDSNVQGTRTAGTDAAVVVVAGNPGSAKPVVQAYTITKSVGQGITLTAEQDRAYLV